MQRIRIVALAFVAAVAFGAFMAPGAATASACGQIKGMGSELQEFAQNTEFIPSFNAHHAPCEEVTGYTGKPAMAGLEAWEGGEFGAWQYVGTDPPPNSSQRAAIELASNGQEVLTIPTLQTAVAIVMHLPAGCTSAQSSDKSAPARLVLNNVTLEEIFSRKLTRWSQLRDDGDELLPAGCEGASEITRVVEKESHGNTPMLKRYLGQINAGQVDGFKTWDELAENKNLEWPEEAVDLTREVDSAEIAKAVYSTPGTIGYANLPNARSVGFYGEGGATFWAFVQDNGGNTLHPRPKYANPESNGTAATQGSANCAKTKYADGIVQFPPASALSLWNEVTSTLKESKYSLCGLLYDLSFRGTPPGDAWSDILSPPGPSSAQVEVVRHYFEFILSAKGQHLLAHGTDRLGLPTNIQLIAATGAAEI